jgi:hypothetical protein
MRDSAVKDRDRMLNRMAEKVAQTERKLEQIENDLRRIRIECCGKEAPRKQQGGTHATQESSCLGQGQFARIRRIRHEGGAVCQNRIAAS